MFTALSGRESMLNEVPACVDCRRWCCYDLEVVGCGNARSCSRFASLVPASLSFGRLVVSVCLL